jgi:cytochrome c oxidase cbb3-type subunit III
MSAPRDEDRLLDHQYDEIQEYDNPLPAWWTIILWATIAWAVLYSLNVIPGVGTGKGRMANYEADLAAAAEKYGSPEQQAAASIDVAAMEAALASPGALAAGKATFETTCAACHEADGGGNIGPNLTDDFWIHGNTHRSMLTVVTNGVPDKGMPMWSAVLTPEQVAQVSAYIATLHGTTPAKAKAPQGEKLGAPVAGEEAAADSTK